MTIQLQLILSGTLPSLLRSPFCYKACSLNSLAVTFMDKMMNHETLIVYSSSMGSGVLGVIVDSGVLGAVVDSRI